MLCALTLRVCWCVNCAECMFMREDTRHHFFMIGAVDIKIYSYYCLLTQSVGCILHS
jgi:hypothetical protein